MAAPIPQVNMTILTNGIGNTAPSPSKTVCVFGCSSAGTDLDYEEYESTPGKVVTDFGYGPGPDLAATLICSGIRTIFVKVPTDVAGAAGAVTHTGTGTAAMTITGTPFDAYQVQVVPVTDGTAGTDPEPTFKVSLDGGRTFSRIIRMPASLTYDGLADTTGLTFVFTAGTLVTDDLYEASCTAPTWNAADVVDALNAFRLVATEASILYLVGACSRANATTISTAVNAFIARDKFVRFFCETPTVASTGGTEDAWMTALEAEWATFTNDRFAVWASGARVQSCISGVVYLRTIGWLAAVRAGLTSPGRDLGAVADGALVPFLQNGQGSPVTEVEHDEGLNPGLNSARFCTVRSYNGRLNYYITNAQLMSDDTSDFDLLQYGRVMDEACRVTNTYFTGQLGNSVRLNRKTGRILEKDAIALENGCDSALEAAIVNTGDASPRDQYCVVSRTDNISTDKTLTVTIGILPLGYIKIVNATLTFVNPALGTAA